MATTPKNPKSTLNIPAANPADLTKEGIAAAADTVLDPNQARPDAADLAAVAPVLDPPKQSSLDAAAAFVEIAAEAAATGQTPAQVAEAKAKAVPDTSLASVITKLQETAPSEPLSVTDKLIAKAKEEADKREAAEEAKAGKAPSPEAPSVPGTDAQAAAEAALAENVKQIDAALAANPTPFAAELLKEARISGSPMILVAAKIARKAADEAEAAARAALPNVAEVATLTAPAGTADSSEGALQPTQPPQVNPKIVAVGPGANALKRLTPTEAAAALGEDTVRVTLPRKIHLTMQDYSTVIFEQGFNLCPISLLDNEYLLNCGMQVIPDPATRVLEPVQPGTAPKTAPTDAK